MTDRLQKQEPHAIEVDAGQHEVLEAPRNTPVVAEVDVLVCGGGPTGIGAALAAAGEGARTLLLERHAMLGGMWTAGLLNPFFNPFKGWLVDRLVHELERQRVWERKVWYVFDTETLKVVLERMAEEAGVEFWYHCPVVDTIVEDGRVRGVITESKSGRQAVLAKAVVDCTGDGDVSVRAGVPYEMGRPRDGLSQPMTMMFEISGFEKLGGAPAERLETLNLMSHLQQAIADNGLEIKLPYGPNIHGTPAFIPLPGRRLAVVQATHVYKVDATNTRDVTRATVAARRQVHEVFMAAMRHIPGMENIRLNQTASTIGIRESRHLEGRYRLTFDDMLKARRFEDAVTSVNFAIDIHEIDPDDPAPTRPDLPEGVTFDNLSMCDIPYRCLLPREVEGLLFAGRCLSGSHDTHAAYRVTGTCMATGQAAGLAAALAADRGVSPSEVDGTDLHQRLAEKGVRFLPRDPSVRVAWDNDREPES